MVRPTFLNPNPVFFARRLLPFFQPYPCRKQPWTANAICPVRRAISVIGPLTSDRRSCVSTSVMAVTA
jgi:hypothetical protein